MLLRPTDAVIAKTVRDHLVGHAALEIRHRRPPDQPADDGGDRGAFVEVPVQDVHR